MKCSGMYFDRFDICEAYYLFASHYHLGQRSKEYEIFGRLQNIQFKPSPILSEESLTENGQEIYQGLIECQERRGESK